MAELPQGWTYFETAEGWVDESTPKVVRPGGRKYFGDHYKEVVAADDESLVKAIAETESEYARMNPR